MVQILLSSTHWHHYTPVHTHVHTNVYTHVHTPVHTHVHTHIHTHVHTFQNIRLHIHKFSNMCMHLFIDICIPYAYAYSKTCALKRKMGRRIMARAKVGDVAAAAPPPIAAKWLHIWWKRMFATLNIQFSMKNMFPYGYRWWNRPLYYCHYSYTYSLAVRTCSTMVMLMV